MNSRDSHSLLDDVFLQPWFLPSRTAIAIRRLLPNAHRSKMRFYFEDYGCIKCGKKGAPYGSNAMCKVCVQQVKLKMLWAIRRRWTTLKLTEELPRTFKRMADAQSMLRDLASWSRGPHKNITSCTQARASLIVPRRMPARKGTS
jgi:hypothetical protein